MTGELDAASLFLPAVNADPPAMMDATSMPEFGEMAPFHLPTSPTAASLSTFTRSVADLGLSALSSFDPVDAYLPEPSSMLP
jgi:hypothetical protein